MAQGDGTDAGGPDEELETVRESPASRGGAHAQATLAMLRDEEIRTARVMIRVGRWIVIPAALSLPLVGFHPLVGIAFAASCALAVVAVTAIEHRLRDPARYRPSTNLVLTAAVMPALFTGLLYWGVFSAAQMYPMLVIYFFSRRTEIRPTFALYLVFAIGQAALAIVFIAHLAPDPGLFDKPVPVRILILGAVLIQMGDGAAFLFGWASRRATLAAVESLRRTTALAARREALLAEARHELDRARLVGGPGRYTDHVFGGYRLGAVLGRGGMGEVYEARHVDDDAPAAVKLLPPRELANPQAVARFVREVQAIRALRSPHVVRVLAASGEDDPIPFLAMERLDGATLSELLRSGPPPFAELRTMLDQVGAALEEAWSQGIVHRDLKPANVFRTREAGWKVLDFGVAALADHGGTLTQGQVVGTPAYMAPEQARGEPVDPRADLYALAAIAYRWLTGQPVCAGDNLQAALYQIVPGAPPRPSAVAAVPRDVDAVLAIGLAKDPADRFAAATELGAALAAALDERLAPALRQRGAELAARTPWRA